MQYNFYGADPYLNERRGIFRTKWNFDDEASL